MPENPALRRLASLPSYHRLTPTQRTAVRLHVGKDIPGVEAMSLAGDPNPARSWKSSRVQKCLADFHGTVEEKSVDDLVREFEAADLEAARAEWLKTPPERIGRTQPPPTDQREPISRPSEPIQETPPKPEDKTLIPEERFSALQPPNRFKSGEVVLGGTDSGISIAGLFPALTPFNEMVWRQQHEDEQQERKRLIAIIEQREANR